MMPLPPTTPEISWREGRLSDVFWLRELAAQAGYPVDIARVRERLALTPGVEAHLVAVIADHPIGAAHLRLARTSSAAQAPVRARLTALVVDSGHRGLGVGSALLARCEEAARALGADSLQMLLPSTRDRPGTFWSGNGYHQPKPGCYIKSLTAPQEPLHTAPTGGELVRLPEGRSTTPEC